jgi:hypothetical protein
MQLGRRMGLGFIADGFQQASDILVEHLEQNPRNDSLVQPIIFGYRQCLELRIKALTATINQFAIGCADFAWGHHLSDLWNGIRQRILEQIQDDDREAFQSVEKVIMEFHKIDPKGDGFRYPEIIKQFNLDLQNMREVIAKTSMFLSSLNDWCDAAVNARD